MTRRGPAVTAYVVALVLWCAVIGIPNDPVGVALWLWLLAICWRLDPSSEFPRDWWPWLLALLVYSLVRGVTDDWGLDLTRAQALLDADYEQVTTAGKFTIYRRAA